MGIKNVRTYSCDLNCCDKERNEIDHTTNTSGWYKVESVLSARSDIFYFCSWACVQKWLLTIKSLKKGTRGCRIYGFRIYGM